MTTVTMVTMATKEMRNFETQNPIFGPGTTASKGSHQIFLVIYVHIDVHNHDILRVANLWFYLGDIGV